jgi:hypothetical protein
MRPPVLADILPAGPIFPSIMPPPELEEGEVGDGGSGGDGSEDDLNSEGRNSEQPTSPPADPDDEQHGSGPSPQETEAAAPHNSIAETVATRRRKAAQELQRAQQARENVHKRPQQANQRQDVESEESGGESSNGSNQPAHPASAGKGRSKEKEKEASLEVIRAAKKKRMEEKEYKPVKVIVDLTGRVSRCQHPP